METVTLKLDRRQIQKLDRQSKVSGRSRAAVVRDLIERHLQDGSASLHERAKDLCGSVNGVRNLSTRRLAGYGRD